MRAVVHQVCRVCGWRTTARAAMDEHVEEKHGKGFPPAQLTRSKDQMEFRPCSPSTPWGRDLR